MDSYFYKHVIHTFLQDDSVPFPLTGPERLLLPGAGEREVLESQQAHGVVLRSNEGAQMNPVRQEGPS